MTVLARGIRSRWLWAVAITVSMTVSAVVALVFPGTARAADNGPYVSLGDSYTAGPFITHQILSAGLCLRSDHDYPALLAQRLGSTSFTDASCSGATTDDLTSTQTLQASAPQFDVLKGNTALVTVGIGGNDIGFSGIALTCAEKGLLHPWGTPCTDHYTDGGSDQVAARIAATAPKIASVLHGIHARSPFAKVVVVGYPAVLPESGDGCWPAVPFASGDLPYLRSVEKGLNAMLARQAADGAATFVDTYSSSVGHDLCRSSDTKWIEGVIPTEPAAPVHPNEAGMRNDAAQIAAALGH